jgi:hypothetical protein
MGDQSHQQSTTMDSSKSENLFVTFDPSYVSESVLLKYGGIFHFRI